MKVVLLITMSLCTLAVVGQDKKQAETPVQILYGAHTPDERRHGPMHSGVLNMKILNDALPVYPQKARDKKIQGRVEVQVLVNGDGEVIFASPLSGPEELWAESVKAAVGARFTPATLAGNSVKIEGRV